MLKEIIKIGKKETKMANPKTNTASYAKKNPPGKGKKKKKKVKLTPFAKILFPY